MPPSIYSPHPGMKMLPAYERKLIECTGRPLGEWVAYTKKHGPKTEPDRRAWLKSEHGLTANYAFWVAEVAEGRVEQTPEELVDAMFAKKPDIRPIYDRLIKLALTLGPDVLICPGKTIVPLYRKKNFAQFKPATRVRLELGLVLGEMKTPRRLKVNDDRITHTVHLSGPAEVDAEIEHWLRMAYELDGVVSRQ